MTFYYRGDGYKMQAIADAISEIYSRVLTVHRQMFPDHHEAADRPEGTTEGKKSAEDIQEKPETKH